MKTGIVRRIDELGRVVIPKELRRTLRLREGEEIEVSMEDGELRMRKYSALQSLTETGKLYAELLHRHTGYHCVVCDTDRFLVSTASKEIEVGSAVSFALEKILRSRKSGYYVGEEAAKILMTNVYKEVAVCPILSCGDVLGGILLVGEKGLVMPDTLVRFLEIGADFLATQV